MALTLVMKNFIRLFISELFYILSLGFIILVILELVWPGLVLSSLNLSFWLLSCLVVGIIKSIIN